MKNIIYIYNDDGVSAESFSQTFETFNHFFAHKYLVNALDTKQIKLNQWQENAALFIIPGGADIPYTRKLNGLGNQNIKQFVQNGGAYLGLCAGAYYGSASIEFDKGGPLEVIGDRELKLFAGKAIGPILGPYDYKTQKGSRAATLRTIFPHTPHTSVYYNGGGYFEHAERFPQTKVLAYYQNKLPAIILVGYGKGQAVLSGVHFEYDPYKLDLSNQYLRNIIPHLIAENTSRKQMLIQILALLNIYF